MKKKYQLGLVSIIMPAYNAEAFLEQSTASVLNQTYSNWELLVIDDCSTDGTASLLRQISQRDRRVSVIRNEKNLGAAGSRNRGLESADGQYVAFLDADDQWDSDKLEAQTGFMREHKAYFTFTAYRIVGNDGTPNNKVIDMNGPDTVTYTNMLKKQATIGCSTVMIDQSETGPLRMPLIKTKEDYALWLEVLRRGFHACKVKKVLTSYRIASNSLSRNKLKEVQRQWTVYREFERINVVRSFWFLLNYGWRAVFRS